MKKSILTIIIVSLLAIIIVLYIGCGGSGGGVTESWDGPPSIAVLSNEPANQTHETDINIIVGGTDVVSYKYDLDGGGWSDEISIATPITASGLSVGLHFILVVAKNANDVWQSEATIYTWTIHELEDPVAVLSNKPNDPTHETDINITVGGTDVVSYKYDLDGGGWNGEISITTPITASGLAVSSHTLQVIAKNANDVWQAEATIYTWTINESVAVLSNKPSNPTYETNINITVGGTDVVSYKYDLDGGGWSDEISITTPITASGLAVGSHTLQVIAKNANDVWQAEATIYTWTINEWWQDPDWTHRCPIVINNTGSALTDYQIKVELVYDADMDPDFNDIRFTESDGKTALSYWRGTFTASTSAVFWVKVPSIPEAAATTIYVYYGNPLAADASDGDATFLFFDDFEDGTIGNPAAGWTSAAGCSGVVIADDGTGNQVLYDGTGGGGNVYAGDPTWTDIAVSQKFMSIDGVVDHAGIVLRFDGPDDKVYGGIAHNTKAEIWIRILGTWTRVGDWTIPDAGTGWHVQDLRIAGDTIELYIDGEFIGAGNVLSAPEDGEAGFWCQYGQEGYRDDHIVRKYVLNEPTNSLGAEEKM